MPSRIELGPSSEIPPRRGKAYDVDGKRIAVFHTAKGWFALDDACPHKGHSLAGGWTDGECVNCPGHGAMFDFRNGKIIAPPASEGVASYEVEEKDGVLFLSGGAL